MQLRNFDANTSGWEQQFFPHYFDDNLEELMTKDVLETFMHADDEWLLDDIEDGLDIFDDDELALLTAPFPRKHRNP